MDKPQHMPSETSADDYFTLLGRISVLFATLDFAVTEVILKISKNETEAFKLPSETATLGKKLRFLKELSVSSSFGMAAIESLSNYLPAAIDMADERNRYTHDQWVFNPNVISKGQIERVKLSSSGLKEKTLLTIGDISMFEGKVAAMQVPFFNILSSPL